MYLSNVKLETEQMELSKFIIIPSSHAEGWFTAELNQTSKICIFTFEYASQIMLCSLWLVTPVLSASYLVNGFCRLYYYSQDSFCLCSNATQYTQGRLEKNKNLSLLSPPSTFFS